MPRPYGEFYHAPPVSCTHCIAHSRCARHQPYLELTDQIVFCFPHQLVVARVEPVWIARSSSRRKAIQFNCPLLAAGVQYRICSIVVWSKQYRFVAYLGPFYLFFSVDLSPDLQLIGHLQRWIRRHALRICRGLTSARCHTNWACLILRCALPKMYTACFKSITKPFIHLQPNPYFNCTQSTLCPQIPSFIYEQAATSITALNLSQNDLIVLPDAIRMLTSLKMLSLESNKLRWTLRN